MKRYTLALAALVVGAALVIAIGHYAGMAEAAPKPCRGWRAAQCTPTLTVTSTPTETPMPFGDLLLVSESLVHESGESRPLAGLMLNGELFVAAFNPSGRVYKFDTPRTDLTSFTSAQLPSSGAAPHARPSHLHYHAGNDRIYTTPNGFQVASGGAARVVVDSVVPSTLTTANEVDDSTLVTGLNASELVLQDGVLLGDSYWVIVGPRSHDSQLIEFDVSDWSVVSQTTITEFEGWAIDTDGTHLYIVGNSGSSGQPGWIAKVDPSNPAAFTKTSFAADELGTADDMAFVGSHVYVGISGGTGQGVIIRVLKSDLSLTTIESGLANTAMAGVLSDGTDVWALWSPTGVDRYGKVDLAAPAIPYTHLFPTSFATTTGIVFDDDGIAYVLDSTAPSGGILRVQYQTQGIRPDGTSAAGNWTAQPSGSLHANTADDDDATYAELDDGDDPSTMVLALADASEPVAGDGAVVLRLGRT